MRMHLFALGLVIGVLGLPARAQFWDSIVNPDVTVTLIHPPGLGLKVQRLAFAPVSDNVTEDLVSACISDLSNSGQIEVLDRGNIEKILKAMSGERRP